MKKTIVEFDLVGYSTIANTYEQGIGPEAVLKLNSQIQEFLDKGLKAVGMSRTNSVLQTTGDGAILAFDQPSVACCFAEAVHEATQIRNRKISDPLGKRVFRAGIATGDLVMEAKPNGGYEFAGMTIARAVRLESKARPGEALLDEATFAGLTLEQKQRCAAPVTVAGKRDERFTAYRCQLNPDGPKDAEFFTGKTERLPISEDSSAGETKKLRKKILELFKHINPYQFDDLIFLLEIPISERPPNTLPQEQRKSIVLEWAVQKDNGLQMLLSELRNLLETNA